MGNIQKYSFSRLQRGNSPVCRPKWQFKESVWFPPLKIQKKHYVLPHPPVRYWRTKQHKSKGRSHFLHGECYCFKDCFLYFKPSFCFFEGFFFSVPLFVFPMEPLLFFQRRFSFLRFHRFEDAFGAWKFGETKWCNRKLSLKIKKKKKRFPPAEKITPAFGAGRKNHPPLVLMKNAVCTTNHHSSGHIEDNNHCRLWCGACFIF